MSKPEKITRRVILPTTEQPESRSVPSCAHCGSEAVALQFWCDWDQELQQWSPGMGAEADSLYCSDCGESGDYQYANAARLAWSNE